jgi:hypothetical protein
MQHAPAVNGSAGGQDGEQPRRRAGGKPWPKGTSGNPSGNKTNKRAAEMFEAMVADLGGAAELSAIDLAMLEQAAHLMVRSRTAKDADIAIRLSNAAARLLTRFKRVPKRDERNDLGAYLKTRYGHDQPKA